MPLGGAVSSGRVSALVSSDVSISLLVRGPPSKGTTGLNRSGIASLFRGNRWLSRKGSVRAGPQPSGTFGNLREPSGWKPPLRRVGERSHAGHNSPPAV